MAEEDQTDQVDDETGTDETAEGEEALADAGKKALDAMKVQRAAARKERDAAKARADTAEAELAKLKAAAGTKTDGDKPAEVDEKKIRDEARKEAQAEALKDRVLDRIEAKAAKLFADPEDARALLAAKVDDFIDDGKVDGDAIAEALAELLKKKPHLGAQGAGGKRFEGGADSGARKGSGGPAQLTENDLKTMTPEQIVQARKDGKLKTLLAG